MNLKTNFMTRNDCYQAGRKITPKGIMVHSTATPGVMAAQWFSRWSKSYAKGEINAQVCVHACLDDKEVFQYLPWNHRGWHCGSGAKGSGNDSHIGFELCEPAGFSYASGAAMVGYDAAKNEPYFRAVWKNAVELCVYLCKMYDFDPMKGGVLICHSEGYKRGIASNHADVLHWFPKHGENMDTFRAAVKAALNSKEDDETMTQDQFNAMFEKAIEAHKKSLAAQPPSAWAKENWEKMRAAGVFDGTAPQVPLTREQAATVIARLQKG